MVVTIIPRTGHRHWFVPGMEVHSLGVLDEGSPWAELRKSHLCNTRNSSPRKDLLSPHLQEGLLLQGVGCLQN